MLFIRGNAISGSPSINGTTQFPKPPIMIGITEENYNLGVSCNDGVVDLVISNFNFI
jgi:hypothetical protein